MSQRYPSARRGRADSARKRVPAVTRSVHRMPFGATAAADGVRFAVWAPSANEVAVQIGDRRVAMERAAQGFYYCFDPDAVPGTRYAFRFDTTDIAIPDPASRFNPDGVHAPSEVVDAVAFEWHDDDWQGRAWAEAVIYELHVGTFTPAGTFAASRRAARLLGRARREYDRAHAARGDPRPLELGLRRRAAIRAARRIRPPRGSQALRRCGSCTRPVGVARRGLQPLRARR